MRSGQAREVPVPTQPHTFYTSPHGHTLENLWRDFCFSWLDRLP
jgi:hypothetical protein